MNISSFRQRAGEILKFSNRVVMACRISIWLRDMNTYIVTRRGESVPLVTGSLAGFVRLNLDSFLASVR